MIINASGGNADAVMTVAQTLSDTQKIQARTNIGALSSAAGAVETEKIKDKNVTAAKLADECKNIIRENVALAASAFVSDTTVEGAQYKAELPITGCTAAMLPIIAWTAAQSEALEVKRIQSAAGKILIYSANAPSAGLTIPTVALISPIGTGSSGMASGGGDTGTLTSTAIIAALGYTPAKSTDIPTALKNSNALKIKIGSTTVTYDGSSTQTVEIADGTEVSY